MSEPRVSCLACRKAFANSYATLAETSFRRHLADAHGDRSKPKFPTMSAADVATIRRAAGAIGRLLDDDSAAFNDPAWPDDMTDDDSEDDE